MQSEASIDTLKYIMLNMYSDRVFRSAVNLSTVLLLVHQLLLTLHLCLDNWSLSHLVSWLSSLCSTLSVVIGLH